MWLLDANEFVLLDAVTQGFSTKEIASAVASRFNIAFDEAFCGINRHIDRWRSAGLLMSTPGAEPGFTPPALEELAQFASAKTFSSTPDGWMLETAGELVWLCVEDETLRSTLEPLLKNLCNTSPEKVQNASIDQVMIAGSSYDWQVIVNEVTITEGTRLDDAVTSIIHLLSDLGCKTKERLIVLHAAGVVSPSGQCVLLPATGGSGKSTLAVALEANGFRLLSDDVVPIRTDGAALGLGLPACIKQGSWNVLSECRPDLNDARGISRYGEMVRYLPPRHQPSTSATKSSVIVFPRYSPGDAASMNAVSPETALQRIVEADAVIRDLTQEKLDQLCNWIECIPAFNIAYPELSDGIELVKEAIEAVTDERD